MPRIARVVVPGLPHHVTQRGNRHQQTFFSDRDYRNYLSLLSWWAPKTGVNVWSYCLMPNHLHLVAVPAEAGSLAACMSEVHQRYTRQINAERDWKGYLWQGRFASAVMDSAHAIATARYIAMNPVRAGLVTRPDEWPYSSARAHLGLGHDGIVHAAAYVGLVEDWAALFASETPDETLDRLRRHTRTGRPLGADAFVADIEGKTGRSYLVRPKGRPVLSRVCQACAERQVGCPH